MFKLNTKHKRKSAIITTILMSLLFVLIFYVGLTYLDPPTEYGIAVNFGSSDMGSGNNQPTAPLKAGEQPQKVDKIEPVVQEKVEASKANSNNVKSEDVATQDTEEAIAIKKQQEAKRKADDLARKQREEDARIERKKQQAIAKQKAKEEAKRKKLDALIGGVSNADGTATGNEGDDNVKGDKGKLNGDPNASGYYNNGGGGGNGDYLLGNRKPLSKPKPDYICNEEGIVVVNIEVDVNGRVLKAVPGVRGSTNTASCLLSQAKEAALKTRWQPDAKAPSKQIGTIRYRFSLSQ
ncbi:MAG TPA: hypothetical protein VJ970_04200 [Flavobacteriaceae bacterium]|nr:hypothetical protein [Flavobacteriaceae bacterium]